MALSDFKDFKESDALFRNSKGKVKPAPELPKGARIADAHCHLGMLSAPALALARCAVNGVRFLECITDPAETAEGELAAPAVYEQLDAWCEQAQDLLEAWGEGERRLPRVRLACGVHPHNAKHYAGALGTLTELLKDQRTSCLGEIGLDYHYDLSPREVQRDVFAQQLQLAHEAELPVELHIREAHEDALAILREVGCPAAGTVLHCFNLDAEALAPFLELDCYISLGGPLTFKKEWPTRLAALNVPIDRLLTETDAPFMAPEPLRGTVCQPDQTLYTARTLLDCFGFAGSERALELINPRSIDIAEGEGAPEVHAPNFTELQCGQDEGAFCALLYRNATMLLDRRPTPWQVQG